MADSKRAWRTLAFKWVTLPAAMLALAGLLSIPVWAADPGSAPVQVARAGGGIPMGHRQPVELAAGDPLGQHVFPEEFPDLEDAVPVAPVPTPAAQPSPEEFQQQLIRWFGRRGMVQIPLGR